MTDFKKALAAGLAANADATAKRAEITAVVEQLSQELQAATNGVLSVCLRDSFREKVRYLTNAFAVLTGNEKEVTKIKYTALTARRVIDPPGSAELAEFELEPTGYPVFVTSSGVSSHAYDRESLERVLAELLQHPDTGARIQRLLDMSTAPTADEQAK